MSITMSDLLRRPGIEEPTRKPVTLPTLVGRFNWLSGAVFNPTAFRDQVAQLQYAVAYRREERDAKDSRNA